jgi:hypothetical protein
LALSCVAMTELIQLQSKAGRHVVRRPAFRSRQFYSAARNDPASPTAE